MKTSRLLSTLAVMTALLLSSCGGGGGNSGGGGSNPPPPPPPPQPETLQIVQTVVPDGLVGQPYTLQMTSKGGNGTVTWKVDNTYQQWIHIDSSTGKVTGTPPAAQQYFATVTATSGTQSVNAPLLIWVSAVLQFSGSITDAVKAFPYDWTGVMRGGKPPVTVKLASGALPPGISLDANGGIHLFGTASDTGTFAFSVDVKDSATTPQSVNVPLSLNVVKILKISSTSLKYAIVGRAYSDTLQYVNGTPPVTWSSQLLNSVGLAVDSATGVVSGTPTSWGYRSFTFTATDSDNPPQSDTKDLTIQIYDVLRTSDPQLKLTPHVGDWVSEYLFVSGGVLPNNVVLAGGALPPGIALQDQRIQGTPTTPGTWTGTLRYSDSAVPPQTLDQPFTITVLPPLPVILSYPTVPVVGEPYSFQMIVAKGTPPYTWSLAGGSLPPNLAISQTGIISGTVTTGGLYSFTLNVTDSASPAQSTKLDVNFSILPKPLGRNDSISTATTPTSYYYIDASISPFEDPPGTTAPDTDYYKLYATEGSTVTVSVQRSQTALDPVLELLDVNGVRLTTCKDLADDSPSAPIVVDTTPNAFDDDCLNDDVSLGVDVNSELMFNVPGTSGKVVTFYAHVLDFQGSARPEMSYTLYVSGGLAPLFIGNDPNIELPQGVLTTVGFSHGGGKDPVTWSVVSGTVPTGMKFNSDGTLTGTPTNLGYWVFTLKITDSSNPAMSATKTFGVRVVSP